MRNREKAGLEIFAAAITMGLAADGLLREVPWGLNAFVFNLLFLAVLSVLTLRHRPEILTPPAVVLKFAILFFATMFLVRDSIELKVFDAIAIVLLLSVLILRTFQIDLVHAGISHYLGGLVWAGINSIFAPFLLIGSDLNRQALTANPLKSGLIALLRGFIIALPLVFIFGILFMSADEAFDDFVWRMTALTPEKVFPHIAVTSVFAVLTAAYFRGTLIKPFARWITERYTKRGRSNSAAGESDSNIKQKTGEGFEKSPLAGGESIVEYLRQSGFVSDDVESGRIKNTEKNPEDANPRYVDLQNFDNSFLPNGLTLGFIETAVIFGLVNLVFLSFVVFQIPYLFGGLDLVQSTPDLKLANFARRGFGELVFASFLVLPMLLFGQWLLRRDSGRTELLFKVLALVQIGLLFVVMASAIQRVLLLTSNVGYGWTPVRFYPTVLILWLGVIFLWFILTVLFGDRRKFAWGSLWFAILILGAANLFNPDAFIVGKNLQLMRQGRPFDAYTNASLGGESVPLLLNALPELNPTDQCMAKWRLHSRLIEMAKEKDLRTWNWSRQEAYKALETSHETLHEHEGCPAWMNFEEVK